MTTNTKGRWGTVCIVVFVAFLLLLGMAGGAAADDVVQSLEGGRFDPAVFD